MFLLQLIIFICFYFSIITTSELLNKENNIAESIIVCLLIRK